MVTVNRRWISWRRQLSPNSVWYCNWGLG